MNFIKLSRRARGIKVAAVGLAAVSLTTAGIVSVGAASASATAAPVTLRIINWVNPPANAVLTKINAEFHKKYPNITVQYQTAAGSPVGAYGTLLQTAVDSNTADIVTMNFPIQPLPSNPTQANENNYQYWTTSGVFSSLTGQPWLKNLTSSALATETYNGNVYGVLSGEYQWVVFYNKADFAKYHLSPPKTYAQFVTILKTLKKNKVTPIWLGLGGGAPGYAQEFLTEPLMQDLWAPHVANGNLTAALDSNTVKWTSPYFLTAMSEEKTIAKYLEPNYTGEPWEGMPGAFASNKAAMLLDGSWDLPSIQKANPKIQVGSFPFPGSNVASQNKPLVADDLTFAILKGSPNQAAAEEWMSFFTSKSIYAQYVNATGISPSESGGTYSNFTSKALGPIFGVGANTAEIFPPLAATNGFWDTDTNFPTLQLAIMDGSKTPAEVAADYQADWPKS
ncbi:MAG TPA: extracellular solute-binding protein [Acidimicrobiales bacterium]